MNPISLKDFQESIAGAYHNNMNSVSYNTPGRSSYYIQRPKISYKDNKVDYSVM